MDRILRMATSTLDARYRGGSRGEACRADGGRGVIQSGATMPGGVAGTTATGGQYI